MIGSQDENLTDCVVEFSEQSTPVPSEQVWHDRLGMKDPEVVAVELFNMNEKRRSS